MALLGLETAEGCVRMGGEIRLQLICQDASGVFAFTSRAAFRHTVQTEGVATGMQVRGIPALQSLEVQLTDGRITLHAVADITLRVVDNGPVKALCGLEGVPDLEMQSETICLPKREEVFREVLPIREEVDAQGVEAVLQRDVLIALRDIQPSEQGTELSGSLTISALVQDQEGRLFQLHQNLPSPKPWRSGAKANTGRSWPWRRSGCGLPRNLAWWWWRAGSSMPIRGAHLGGPAAPGPVQPQHPLRMSAGDLPSERGIGPGQPPAYPHETVNIPSGMPEAQRVVYCAVRPVITAAAVDQDRVCMEGLLVTRILYEGADGHICAFTEDIPFETACPAPGASEAMVSPGRPPPPAAAAGPWR